MDEEIQILKLSVKQVIGRGDALDSLMLMPLIIDWRVPKNCIWNKKRNVTLQYPDCMF